MEKWKINWSILKSLNAVEVNSIPEKLPGVYRLSYKAEDEKTYVFYVGQAVDIKTRLKQHFEESENICIKNYTSSKSCYFRFAIIRRDYVRNAVERLAYKKYRPSCNEKEPEGSEDVFVNLN